MRSSCAATEFQHIVRYGMRKSEGIQRRTGLVDVYSGFGQSCILLTRKLTERGDDKEQSIALSEARFLP